MKRYFILFAVVAACLLTACRGKRDADSFDVWGIDVSKHQSHVNWTKMCKRHKPHFVFLKATEGSLIVDPTYARHAKELDKHGVLRGAYHFFGHRTSGKVQADNFIKTARLKKGNLVPVLDIEKNRLMTDPAKSVREAKAFCEEIKRHYGVYPIIYCSNLFYHQHLKRAFPHRKFTLWVADYRGEPSDIEWRFWQHTDCHKIKGIKGGVDRNVFRGDMEDLEKYVMK